MAEKFSVQAVFTAVDHFSGPVSRMSDTLNKFNRKGGSGGGGASTISTKFRDAGAVMGRMGERARAARNTVTALGVAGGFAAHRMVTAGADLEDALLIGSSKFGDGIRRHTPEFEELKRAALDLGRTTKFGAIEAAGALNELAASGFEPKAAIKNLPILGKMALAGGEELQTASMIAVDSLGAFKMITDEMGNLRGPDEIAANLTRVADVMAYTANQTTASMGSMYETLSEAGPIADVAGMTFEKFAAITGTLAQIGIKGSQAGTAIKNINVRLLSPTTEGDKELKRLGIDKTTFRKMADPLDQLEVFSQALEKLPKEEKIKALDEYFGKIPLAAASFLAGSGFRNARVLEAKIHQNAAGSNERQSAIIGEGTSTKLGRLGNAFERINTAIFEKIKDPLEEATESVINFIDANEEAISDGFRNGITFLKTNMPQIVQWLKWGGYAILGMQAAGALHSVVTFGQDMVLLARAAGTVVTWMSSASGATVAFNTVTMGRGLPAVVAMAGGMTALAGAASLAAGAMASAYLVHSANEDLKKTTEGMGILDIGGMMLHNAINGGPLDPAKIVSDHQDMLARKRFLADLNREKMTGSAGPSTFDDALAGANTPAGVMAMLSQLEAQMKLSPLTVPPEAITVNPVDTQPITDAIAAQISANTPQVVTTPEQNASSMERVYGTHNQTDAVVTVRAEPGTKANTTRSTHTKPNNHRTGTN